MRRRALSLRAWVIGAVVAGLATGISSGVASIVLSGGHAVKGIVSGPGASSTSNSAAGGAATPDVSATPNGVLITTPDGVYISASTNDGTGCGATGYVFPAAAGLTDSTAPGTGPKRNGKTWDAAPGLFGAVNGPEELSFTVTGPASHAIILTGLKFHVLSREDPIVGPWLNTISQCGGGGQTYAYGAVDFSHAPPYWIAPGTLPSYEVSSAIQFPYTVTANQPVIFLIDITAKNCECTWYADLSWTDDGSIHTATLNKGGKPFVFTTVAGLTEVEWWESNGIWQSRLNK